MTNRLLLLLVALLLPFLVNAQQNYITVGEKLANVNIKTPDDKPTKIPFLGEKVLAIFYNDPDVKDINDPLSDGIKAKHFSKEKYQGIGIANCKDTWLPNSLIRYAGRQKQAKYPSSIILVDDDYVISKAWKLGNCNELSYFIIVGSDSKVKYVKSVKSQEESKAIIPVVLDILEKEINK